MTDLISDWVIRHFENGLKPIPVNTKTNEPKVKYAHYENQAFTREEVEKWIALGLYNDGIAILTGLCDIGKFRKLYVNVIDFDSSEALNKLLQIYSLEQISQQGIFIEQHHDNKGKAHLWIFSTSPFPKLSSNKGCGFEVKSSGSLCNIFPSLHEGGYRYFPFGDSLKVFTDGGDPLTNDGFVKVIDKLTDGTYLNGKGEKNYNPVLINKQKIPNGQRHGNLLSQANSLVAREHKTTNKETIRKYFEVYNNTECEEPLGSKVGPEQQMEIKELKQIFDDSWNNIMKGNGEAKQETQQTKDDVNEDKELLEQKLTKQDINFVIDTITKEAKHDRMAITQTFHGFNTGLTKTVLHGSMNSKNAGSGKNYILSKVADYYPRKYVLELSGASDKAFQHKDGIMVLEDKETGILTETEPILNKLHMEIADLEHDKEEAKDNKSLIKNLKQQILQKEIQVKSILNDQIKLIILSDTIIIFLDTPQEGVTDNLMSILSNDITGDQKYFFAEKSTTGKMGAKYNILRGTPVVFYTRVIDDSRSVRFEEKNRRFVNINPNVSEQKIEGANNLMWQQCGLTPEEYDNAVVSREDKDKAKRIIAILVAKLINHSRYLKPKEFGIKIPFLYSIKIPNNDVWAMTVIDRMRKYLAIITKENMDSRPRLVRKDNPNIFLPISTFEDLKDTLELMEIAGSNVRPYLAQWYNEKFLPVFNAENDEIRDKEIDIGKDKDGNTKFKTISEDYVSVTTKQLCEITNVNNEILRHKYLHPLENQGLINKTKSNIKRNENIYWPADSKGENLFTLFRGEDIRLDVKDPRLYPSKFMIIDQVTNTKGMFGDKSGSIKNKNLLDTYMLLDENNTEITPEQLADRYFSDPETCFNLNQEYFRDPIDILTYQHYSNDHFNMYYLGKKIIKNNPPLVPVDSTEHLENVPKGQGGV